MSYNSVRYIIPGQFSQPRPNPKVDKTALSARLSAFTLLGLATYYSSLPLPFKATLLTAKVGAALYDTYQYRLLGPRRPTYTNFYEEGPTTIPLIQEESSFEGDGSYRICLMPPEEEGGYQRLYVKYPEGSTTMTLMKERSGYTFYGTDASPTYYSCLTEILVAMRCMREDNWCHPRKYLAQYKPEPDPHAYKARFLNYKTEQISRENPIQWVTSGTSNEFCDDRVWHIYGLFPVFELPCDKKPSKLVPVYLPAGSDERARRILFCRAGLVSKQQLKEWENVPVDDSKIYLSPLVKHDLLEEESVQQRCKQHGIVIQDS